MKKLNEKTKDFILAIKETREFQNFQEAEEEYRKDKDAQSLLKDFHIAQQNLIILKQGNFSGQEEQKEKIKSLERQVSSNEIIKEWIEARKNFQSLIDQLAENISSDINFPFKYIQKSRGCCG